MAKPNYAFAKRQRDLAKQKKKEEKRLKKVAAANDAPDAAVDTDTTDSPPASTISGQG